MLTMIDIPPDDVCINPWPQERAERDDRAQLPKQRKDSRRGGHFRIPSGGIECSSKANDFLKRRCLQASVLRQIEYITPTRGETAGTLLREGKGNGENSKMRRSLI